MSKLMRFREANEHEREAWFFYFDATPEDIDLIQSALDRIGNPKCYQLTEHNREIPTCVNTGQCYMNKHNMVRPNRGLLVNGMSDPFYKGQCWENADETR